MAKTEHVGLTALDAERSKLLKEYDTAVEQAGDDPVKTEHGVSCEAHFRTFLEQFLPKKYGKPSLRAPTRVPSCAARARREPSPTTKGPSGSVLPLKTGSDLLLGPTGA